MLSRRLIRIKVFKVLFSNVTAGDVTLKSAQNELMLSCEKTQELSMFMLNVAIALKNAAEAKIELGLKKFKPTPEEASPNRKFAENKFVQLLLENEEFLKYCQNRGLIWNDELLIYVRKLFNEISQKEYFQEYMNSGESSFEEDCNIFSRIFEEEFEDSEELYSFLEDMSVYWIDDIDYVLNIILRIITSVKKDKKFSIPSIFIKEDDKEYAIQLLDYSLTNYQSLLAEVSKNISNWDSERLVEIGRASCRERV